MSNSNLAKARPGAVTIHDVAALAGVSLVTVSRAINDPRQLSAKTLAKVLAAVERTGYVPNISAGSLRSSRTRLIAAFVPNLQAHFASMIQSMTNRFAEHRYQVLMGQIGYSMEQEAAMLRTVVGRRPDGIVLTGVTHSPEARRLLADSGIPVVETWDLTSDPIDMLVGFSNLNAGRAAADHLLDRGHRALAFIGAEEERSRLRLEGFRAGAAARGAAEVEVELIRPPALIDDAGPRLAQILSRRPDTTAVFCNNDLLAAGVLFECRRRGWDVPGRIAVMGFGDLAVARAASPRLSTVLVRRAEMGERAGQMLLARLSGESGGPKYVDIGFEVIARAST